MCGGQGKVRSVLAFQLWSLPQGLLTLPINLKTNIASTHAGQFLPYHDIQSDISQGPHRVAGYHVS